jgi:hypothetical protein
VYVAELLTRSLENVERSSGARTHERYKANKTLRQAVKWDLIARNPVDAVNSPKVERHEARIVGAEGFAKLAAFAADSGPERADHRRTRRRVAPRRTAWAAMV